MQFVVLRVARHSGGDFVWEQESIFLLLVGNEPIQGTVESDASAEAPDCDTAINSYSLFKANQINC